jgi:hypothetical protein
MEFGELFMPLYFWRALQRRLDRPRPGGRVGAADEKLTATARVDRPERAFRPTATTWREPLYSLGYRLDTQDDIERVCIEKGRKIWTNF